MDRFAVESAHSPAYADEGGVKIDLVVKFAGFAMELPFTADPNDCEEHGRALWARAQSEEFGVVATYVPPVVPPVVPSDSNATP